MHLQLRKLEAVLAGALRRELSADNKAQRLAAEIATVERLVRQHEHAVFCARLVVKFREDRIKRLEALSKDVLPVDEYYQQVRAVWTRPCGPVLGIETFRLER
jgi:kinesin family protein 15